jgi:hypothetical protein
MFTEERDRWDVLIGVIVVALVAGGAYVIKSHAPETTPPPPIGAAAPSRETPRIEMDHGSVEPAAESPVAVAYECWRDEQRILSDRPCGSDASIRAIAEPNRMDAQDTTQLYRPAHAAPNSRRVPYGTSSSFPESSACAEIERAIDAINARMRQRYTSAEGERFRARLRDFSNVCAIASSAIPASDQVLGGTLELPGLSDGNALLLRV